MMDRGPESASSAVVAEAILMSARAECLLLDLAELKQQVEATHRLLRAYEDSNQVASRLQC